MKNNPLAAYWLSRTRRLVWRINLGWWLARFAPQVFGLTFLAIPPLLWLRGAHPEKEFLFWAAYPLALLLAAVCSFFQARPRFENRRDALARLDLSLGLHNRLTAAAAGVGPWPTIAQKDTPAARWALARATGLLGSSAALLLLAAFFPIDLRGSPQSGQPEIPPPLTDITTWTRQLTEEKIIEPQALEALEEKIDQLLQRPADDWYKASTLEAAEHLREQTAQSLQNLAKNLAAIENAVAQAQAFQEHMPEGLSAALQESLAEALRGLDLSELPLNASQRDLLRQLDMKSLTKMTPEQLAELRENLKKNRTALARNGATQHNSSSKKGPPAPEPSVHLFLFSDTSPDPLESLVELFSSRQAHLIRPAMNPLSPAEKSLLDKNIKEKRLRAFQAEGCVPGNEYEGFVLLPDSKAFPGVIDPDESLVLDALYNLLLDPSARATLNASHLSALRKALAADRVRLDTFPLHSCQGGSCMSSGNSTCLVATARQGGNPGGKGGGPSVPLTLDRDPSGINAAKKENLSSEDRQHDTLGDLQGLGTGKHKVDQNAYQGPSDGGTTQHQGAGGDAVWTDNLTPEERATLREYFQ